MADDSIHVSEPRVENSGLKQGTLIRRHRIPVNGTKSGEHLAVPHFNVGLSVNIYARTFTIYACDPFTRVLNFVLKID